MSLTDLLFPPRCLLCGDLDEAFCATCRASILRLPGRPLPPAGISAIISVGPHTGALRDAVLRLKFGQGVALVEPMAELLAAELAPVEHHWRITLCVPVPLHWLRRLERGFNQAELLAEAVARRTGVRAENALCRRRYTPSQVAVAQPALRRHNLLNAIAARPNAGLAGQRILLIDDVWTTGTTLTECSRVLRAAGAADVFALTVTSPFTS